MVWCGFEPSSPWLQRLSAFLCSRRPEGCVHFEPLCGQNGVAPARSLQLCPTLYDPIDSSPPGSSIHGIFQARVPEWGAIAFSENGVRHIYNNVIQRDWVLKGFWKIKWREWVEARCSPDLGIFPWPSDGQWHSDWFFHCWKEEKEVEVIREHE